MRFRAGRTCGACVLGALLFAGTIFYGPGTAAAYPQAKPAKSTSASKRPNASRTLYMIGEKISTAVLDKDIPTLLSYDRADSRAADETSLKNTNSDLYCYVFNSECITWGDGSWRSVYDKISQAQHLQIKANVSSSPYDRQLYGSLFFYDAAVVSEKDLRSRDFVCKQGPASIASWKFRLEHGKWKAVTPLFDSETRDCPSDVEGNGQ